MIHKKIKKIIISLVAAIVLTVAISAPFTLSASADTIVGSATLSKSDTKAYANALDKESKSLNSISTVLTILGFLPPTWPISLIILLCSGSNSQIKAVADKAASEGKCLKITVYQRGSSYSGLNESDYNVYSIVN